MKILCLLFFVSSLLWTNQLWGQQPNSELKSLIIDLKKEAMDSHRVKKLARLTQLTYESEPEKAIKYIEEAIQLSLQLDYSKGLSIGYNLIGNIYCDWGDYDLGVDYYFKSLEISERAQNFKNQITVYANLGKAFWEMGELENAIDYQKKSLQGNLKIKDLKGVAISYLNLGAIYSDQNKKQKALEYFVLSKNLADSIGIPSVQAISLNNIASIQIGKDHTEEAEKNAKEGLKIALAAGNSYYILPFYSTLGGISLQAGNYSQSLAYLKQAEDIASKHGFKRALPQIYLLQSDCYHKLDSNERRFSAYQQYTAIKDSLYNEHKIQNIRHLEAKYKNEKRLKEIQLLQKDKVYNQSIILGLSIVTILIVFILLLSLRQSRLKAQYQKSELHKKALELEHKLLRSQINPHFIFNVLNSIQKFFLKGDEDNVYKSIANFSSLLRGILENSDKTFVSIEEELRVIRLYMEIEQLRVKNHFSFDIQVDPQIDIYNTNVPSMLLQPYVENAIWHGLMNKVKGGTIKIEVKQEHSFIYFIVEDDGIGRLKSQKLKEHSSSKHKSKGLQLMEDRIAVINEMNNLDMQINVIDLKEDGLAKGTRISIRMKNQ